MKFNLEDYVAIRCSPYKGRIIGMANYALNNKLNIAYVIYLDDCFTDPSKTVFIKTLIAQEKELAIIKDPNIK